MSYLSRYNNVVSEAAFNPVLYRGSLASQSQQRSDDRGTTQNRIAATAAKNRARLQAAVQGQVSPLAHEILSSLLNSSYLPISYAKSCHLDFENPGDRGLAADALDELSHIFSPLGAEAVTFLVVRASGALKGLPGTRVFEEFEKTYQGPASGIMAAYRLFCQERQLLARKILDGLSPLPEER